MSKEPVFWITAYYRANLLFEGWSNLAKMSVDDLVKELLKVEPSLVTGEHELRIKLKCVS